MANPKLNVVKSRFSSFVKEAEMLRTQLELVKAEKNELEAKLAEKDGEIAQLHDRLSERKIAQAVVGQYGIEVNEAKQKITELMREIDRCIALLNV